MSDLPQTKPVCQLDAEGFYVCQTVADADPMQPENWLIPAGCIDTEPPEVKPNLAAKWQPESKTWAYLPDHRGKTAYRTDNGQPETVETVGELPAHLTTIAPPSELHEWNAEKQTWQLNRAKQKATEQAQFQAAQAQAAWVTSSQLAQELFTQCPQAFRQNLKSLLYFTQHTRIAQTLTALGASHVHTVARLSDALHHFSSRSIPK